jgi:hypothetical protein
MLIIAALALAVFGIVLTVLRRAPGRSLLVGAVGLEVLLVAQAVIAAVQLIAGARPAEFVTFIGYLVASVIVMPLALQWTKAEANRWNGAVIAVGAVAIAAAVGRMLALWGTVGAS